MDVPVTMPYIIIEIDGRMICAKQLDTAINAVINVFRYFSLTLYMGLKSIQ